MCTQKFQNDIVGLVNANLCSQTQILIFVYLTKVFMFDFIS